MTESNLVALVKQGDVFAIASLLNLTLQSRGMTAQVQIKDTCLQIRIESLQVPNQKSTIFLIKKTLNNLSISTVESIKVYGQKTGASHSDWTESLEFTLLQTDAEFNKSNLRQLAKESNLEAITLLINRAVEHKNITAQVNFQDNYLEINLKSIDVPNQNICTTLIIRELKLWQNSLISNIHINGQKSGDAFPEWTQQLDLTSVANFKDLSVYTPKVNKPKKINKKISINFDFNNLDHFQAGLIILIAIYGICGSFNPGLNGPFIWLHFPDLAIHETGHLLFMIIFGAGSFMHILGGSLTQILFPAVFAIYFFYIGQRYSSAITLFWTAQNFMDVSVYIKDAQARELPLTVDDPDAHDWYNLLDRMNILQYDQQMGNFVYFMGFLIFLISVISGIYFSQLPETLKKK